MRRSSSTLAQATAYRNDLSRKQQATRLVGDLHRHQQGRDALEDLRWRAQCRHPDQLPVTAHSRGQAEDLPRAGELARTSGQAVQGVVGSQQEAIEVFYLPSYGLELNPDEMLVPI